MVKNGGNGEKEEREQKLIDIFRKIFCALKSN